MTSGLAQAERVVRNLAASTTVADLYVPVGAADAGPGAKLRVYGVVEGEAEFVPGWRFRWPVDREPRLVAFARGTLVFRAAEGAQPARLVLRFEEPLGDLLRGGGLPDWFPVPTEAVYAGVDPQASRPFLRAILEGDAVALTSTRTLAGTDLTVDQVLDRFFAGTLNGLSVRPGQTIGVAGSTGTSRELLFTLRAPGVPDGWSLDPATYARHWRTQFVDLGSHPWDQRLSAPFGGPIQNGVARYVDAFGVGAAPFTDPDAPGHDLRAVLDACDPGDSVVVVGTHPFELPKQLVVDRAVTITSLAQRAIAPVTDKDDAQLATLPELRATGGRVLWVPATHLGDGIATVAGVRITKGQGEHEQDGGFGAESYQKGGGGLLVTGVLTGATIGPDVDYDAPTRLYVRDCLFEDNEVDADPGLIPGERFQGFGGGILCRSASPYVFGNVLRRNTTIKRGGGLAVLGFGWPRIEENHFYENEAGDGGGIGLEVAYTDDRGFDALGNLDPAVLVDMGNAWHDGSIERAQARQVQLIRNVIRNNRAGDDGGGLYASVVSRFRMVDCVVQGNEAQQGGGGGIRITYASAGEVVGGSVIGNRSNALGQPFGSERSVSGGGGIAVRNSDLSLDGVWIQGNVATGFAGGGVYFNITSSGSLSWVADVVDLDYDDIMDEAFGNTRFSLSILGGTEVVGNRCTLAPPDGDHRKGGGVYVARISKAMVGDVGYEPRELELRIDQDAVLENNELVANSAVAGDQPSTPGSSQLHVADYVLDLVLDDDDLFHDGDRIGLSHLSQ